MPTMSHQLLAISLVAGFALTLATPSAFSDPPEKKKEKQSAFKTADGKIISSSSLIKTLKSKLGGKYEDLELVISACGSGEFATRAKAPNGLGGNFSVSTSTDTEHVCQDRIDEDKDEKPNDKEGLKIGDDFFHGYMAQYAKKIKDGKNTVGNKDLHDFAEENKHQTGDDPNYQSSGKAADDMTVHGGTTSNHAIVFQAATYNRLSDELVKALKGAGYTDKTITYLTGTGKRNTSDGSKSDGAAFEKDLNDALDDLRKELDKNPNKEKAYIFIDGHGSYRDRTVAFANIDTGLPGAGLLITTANPTLDIFTDSPELLVGLKEELPMAGGGLWADDPLLQRRGQPYIAFSTSEEFFVGSTITEILLDGLSLGSLTLGNAFGNDYHLDIADEILDSLLPSIEALGTVELTFQLPNELDFLRLATEGDYLSPNFPHLLDYGVSIGGIIGSLEPLPEPSTLALLGLGLLGVGYARRQKLQ